MMSFKNKKFLITGGTGSFGSATINKLLKEKVGEIVIFSRDEKNSMIYDFCTRVIKN